MDRKRGILESWEKIKVKLSTWYSEARMLLFIHPSSSFLCSEFSIVCSNMNERQGKILVDHTHFAAMLKYIRQFCSSSPPLLLKITQ